MIMEDYEFLKVKEDLLKVSFLRIVKLALLGGTLYASLLLTLFIMNLRLSNLTTMLIIGFLAVLASFELLVKHNSVGSVSFLKNNIHLHKQTLTNNEKHLLAHSNISSFLYKKTFLDYIFDTVTLQINNHKFHINKESLKQIKKW